MSAPSENGELQAIADQLVSAFEARDLSRLEPLLGKNVRWGEDDRACYNPGDVLRTFAQAMAAGAKGTVLEASVGASKILLGLEVEFSDREQETFLRYQVYSIKNGVIAKIEGFDDRKFAAKKAGVASS